MQISPRIAKPVLVVLALSPAAYLAWAFFHDELGANPIEMLTRETGVWTLRFIVATLVITPLRRLSGWNALVKYRRMLGLFAFFYGTVHLLTYVWLDQFFDVQGIVKDVLKRPFITMGMIAFLAMLPLALTSTTGWIRRLGGKRWQAIHRDLPDGDLRRDPLLLAGEGGRGASDSLRRDRHGVVRGARHLQASHAPRACTSRAAGVRGAGSGKFQFPQTDAPQRLQKLKLIPTRRPHRPH